VCVAAEEVLEPDPGSRRRLRRGPRQDEAITLMLDRATAATQPISMSHNDFQTLVDRISVPYQAAIERRQHQQRGGDRRPGTRRGVFHQ
jgi:hypothetical protein